MATLLTISGSTRAGSTNTATLRTAAAAAPGVIVVHYAGLAELPAFNPDDDREPLPDVVAALRRSVDAADGVLFCTPEYAGALPGSFKNLLDWLVGSIAMSDKPCGWINVSSVASPTGGAGAHDSLRTVLGYVQARVVEDACIRMPLSRNDIDPDGLVAGDHFRTRIAGAVAALVG